MNRRQNNPMTSQLGLSLSGCLEEYYKYLREQPRARKGLHVSDISKGVGASCLRFVQLALNGADQNPVPLDVLTQKRLFHGQALHGIIYEHLGPALTLLLKSREAPLRFEMDIEVELTSELGLKGTPDAVIRFFELNEDSQKPCETWVLDVKTREPNAFHKTLRLDGHRHIEADVARQIQLYGDMVEADVLAVLWVESGVPYALDQTLSARGGRALKDAHSRMRAAQEFSERGSFAPKRVCESCKWCRFKVTCDEVDR